MRKSTSEICAGGTLGVAVHGIRWGSVVSAGRDDFTDSGSFGLAEEAVAVRVCDPVVPHAAAG
jgi:hypothetical protein